MTAVYRGAEERALARAVTEAIRDRESLLRLDRIDLTAAVEHSLYAALRAPSEEPVHRLGSIRAVARVLHAAARSTAERPRRGRSAILILVHAAIHLEMLQPVMAVFRDRGLPEPTVMRAGFQTAMPAERALRAVERTFDATWVRPLTRHAASVRAILPSATAAWDELVDSALSQRLRRVTAAAAPRLALSAARIDSALRQTDARLIACFNESGIWSRLVPAAAHANGLSAVDLPHGEFADPWGIAGASFDALGVYGSRAARVMEMGGIEADRIKVVGSTRYDAFMARLQSNSHPLPSPRIVLASQPLKDSAGMTRSVKAGIVTAAIAAAAALAPARLELCLHPLERDTVATEAINRARVPDAVKVSVNADLYSVLPSASLLITGWSQSVFEAAIAGIPSIVVCPTGSLDPAGYAADGLASVAHGAPDIAAVARRLHEPEHRRVAVELARRSLRARLGILDGRAAERVADLLLHEAAG